MEDAFISIFKTVLIFLFLLSSIALAGIYLISDFKFDPKRINVIKSFSFGTFLAFSLMTLLRDADVIFKKNLDNNSQIQSSATFDDNNDYHGGGEINILNSHQRSFPFSFLACFLSITINFVLEKFSFEPRVNWMKRAKQPWQAENLRVRLEKKISVLEIKEIEIDTQTMLGLDNQINEIKEKLHKKLNASIKEQQMMVESIRNIKEALEITSYDSIESEDYLEILEHKLKKSIGLFFIFVYNLRCLQSKKATGEKKIKVYHKLHLKSAGLAIFLQLFLIGLAIGTQTDVNNLLSIVIGVAIYSLTQSIELGSSFQPRYHIRRRFFFFILAYSIIIPAGIALGWLVSAMNNKGILTAVLLSIASGNLLFVVLLKCPFEEFFISRMKLVKSIGFFLGLFVVVIFHFNEFTNDN